MTMLVVTQEQLDAFQKAANDDFVQELIQYTYTVKPKLCKNISSENLNSLINLTVDKADTYEISSKNGIKLLIKLSLYCRNISFFSSDEISFRVSSRLLTSPT